MATLLWQRSEVTVPGIAKLRWQRSEASGSVPAAAGALRWLRSEAGGALAVIVAPIANLVDVEPEAPVTITAALVGGGAADSWQWRPISGLPVGLAVSGASVTFSAPSNLNGGSVVLGVQATKDGIVSTERTVTISVLPQTEWLWSGTGWIPHVRVWAA